MYTIALFVNSGLVSMSQSLLNKVWSFLAVVLLYLSLNVWSITQQWQLTLPGNPFKDCKISPYGVTLYGIPLCGVLLMLTSIISISYARRSYGTSWAYRFPRFADFELDMTRREALVFQAVMLIAFVLVPSVGSIHFLQTMMNGTVYRGDQHFASGWREQLFKLPAWHDVKAGLFTYDKTVVCDDAKAALSFLPFWLPWLLVVITVAVALFVLWSLVEVFRSQRQDETMNDERIVEGIAQNKAEKTARIDRSVGLVRGGPNMAENTPSRVVYEGSNANFHTLVVGRVYHEDMLFAQRSYILLGVHAFLMTAFTYLASILVKGKSPALLWLIAISLASFGALLGIFQASFGRQTGRAIGFWREYLKIIEDTWQVPFDHLQYRFYAVGKAETPFGVIDKEKASQKALYELFGKRTRWLTSMTTVLGLLFPAGLALFWTLALSYTLQQLTERYSVSVSACAVLLLLGVLVLRPSLAKAKYSEPDTSIRTD